MAERTLLANARVLTCSGDPAERPFDGDVLIEGNRIAEVAGRADSTSTRVGAGRRPARGHACCPGSGTRTPTSAGRSTSSSTTPPWRRRRPGNTRSTWPR